MSQVAAWCIRPRWQVGGHASLEDVGRCAQAWAQALQPPQWHSPELHLMLCENLPPSARLGDDGNSAELQASLPHFSEAHLNHSLLLGTCHVALRHPFRHMKSVHRPVKRTSACFPLLGSSSCVAFEHFPAGLKHLHPREGGMCLTVDSFLHQFIFVLLTVPPF